MTIEAVAVLIGAVAIAIQVTWDVRGRLGVTETSAELNLLADALRQATNDRETFKNDAASWHYRALTANQRLDALELLLVEHGIEVPA